MPAPDHIVIQAQGLSKQYRIGAIQRAMSRSLRETLTEAAKTPFRRLQSVIRNQTANIAEETIWALKDVSFEVRQGEVVGIIGRNGAGKSTLLKILSRITVPTEGSAIIHGRVGSLLEVGTGFNPELTGRENVYLNGAILGMKKAEIDRKLDEIVAFAEVERFIDTPVKHYSSGMTVRLAFAVAAHLEPEILLVDEVLAVGDLAFQRKCLGKMQDVSQSGRTVLFVSHNMPAVTRLCTRAILLEAGRVVANGPTNEVVGLYTQRMLAGETNRVWDMESAPGRDGVKLMSVSVLKDGKPVVTASVQDSLEVRVGYYVEVPNLKFRCMIILFTQGVVAFPTLEQEETVRENAGLYYSRVTIPPNLLAEGEYIVGISIMSSRGGKHHYVQEYDTIAFHVYDPIDGTSARGDYAQRLAGVLRPLLPWRTEFAGEMTPETPDIQQEAERDLM